MTEPPIWSDYLTTDPQAPVAGRCWRYHSGPAARCRGHLPGKRADGRVRAGNRSPGKAQTLFSHVSPGTRDRARALPFHDAILAPLGHARIEDHDPEDRSAARRLDDPGPHLWVTQPFDGAPATPGNGTMVPVLAPSRAAVDALDAFHAAALAHGGTDAGAPGLRPHLRGLRPRP
ncbi:MAG: VOC family protein [Tabrizicola sp.]